MSVLECNRRECPNVMCGRLSDQHGYICEECFDELVARGQCENIDDFMNSIKKDSTKDEAVARFNAAFPVCGES